MSPQFFSRKSISWHNLQSVSLTALVVLIHVNCLAADPGDAIELGEILVEGTSRTPELTRIEPTAARPMSTLTSQAIKQVAPLTSDFGTLANFLPSFLSSAPNGNGFDAAKSMTLRGFPDGQFNVTLDGIPFADPDTFAHHSTSLFPASSIESIQIDRGPGDGTTLGYSTIGGSLNIASLRIPRDAGAQVYGAYGSFATSLAGVRLNTQAPRENNATGLMVNLQHMQTAGALANNDGHRDDVLLKSESKLGGLHLTLLYSYDDYHFINAPSVTTDQVATQGSRAGLTKVPGTALFNGFAKTNRSSDFGYARLQGQLSEGLGFNETLYTYSYANSGLSVNGDITLPASYQVGKGFGVNPTDIAGRLSTNDYRTVGNILRFTKRISEQNVLQAGLWLEHSHQVATRNADDLSTETFYAANKKVQSSALYDYRGTVDTIQPFMEDQWKPIPALTIEAGLRYQTVKRGFNATVVPNSKPATPGQVDRSVHTLLPSLETNYAFTPATHGYLHLAKGALVPSQAFFYTNNPAFGNQAQPQTSRSIQSGVIYVNGPISFTTDVYLVNLNNYISTTTDANKNTIYLNNGHVRYRGLEAEANADVGHGWTMVANASIVRAKFGDPGIVSGSQQAGDTIPLAPKYLGLLGALYDRGPWSGSLIAKFVGTEFQGPGGSSEGNDRRVPAYSYTNLTFARKLDQWNSRRHAVISLNINNVLNRASITDSAGRSAIGPGGPLLVNVLPSRNYMLSFRCDL
jgi:iron complex outermembrane receptor protein